MSISQEETVHSVSSCTFIKSMTQLSQELVRSVAGLTRCSLTMIMRQINFEHGSVDHAMPQEWKI